LGHSKHETSNHIYTSYVLKTGKIKWVVTAPYLSEFQYPGSSTPHPKFDPEFVKNWVMKHGSGVAVIGLRVGDATRAYELSTGKGCNDPENWAKGHVAPIEIKSEKGSVIISEILVYGETILRFIEYKDGYDGVFLPGYQPLKDPAPLDYGIMRMDHVVGNVYNLNEITERMSKWFGFHEFAAFTKEDIETEYTSLNSTVMANNTNTVLLPINEPAKKKKNLKLPSTLKLTMDLEYNILLCLLLLFFLLLQ